MVAFWQFIVGGSLSAIVYRVFALLGIGLITYVGSDLLISELGDLVANQFGFIPDIIGDSLGVLNIDRFMSIVVSAYAIKLAIQSTLGQTKRVGVR